MCTSTQLSIMIAKPAAVSALSAQEIFDFNAKLQTQQVNQKSHALVPPCVAPCILPHL